ncbi:NADPH:adrenodoxin oxidoreductase, mitochondrial [Selaginella moellendorffii]|uniref:NADPH:adrenodoxin oxidoreductase, mitochondrial n=1 Tax=Selaginella moellendorffii TaxID=88036 RepID=UPI000D1D0D22|nr:NADPH:adrenodoxin oxidoreductase, mitochondrial [Selaginella moellendorffii]|eukprot:XP_024518798.1 NADPH:adrenodoxin oxidoreductase, mitochondrial [Selaginella moellendorffii]
MKVLAMARRASRLGLRFPGRSRDLCTGSDDFGMPLHVCVVGSGPAGFYVAKKLLKRFDFARVDILERLPAPFGLVRSGVAPDHPETKVVINQFSRTAEDERCRFFGNVCLGTDVSLEELRKNYHVVVLAYGAESDHRLGIPGEDLEGVFSARQFVWWYNGHPDGKDLPINLNDVETAVVLGQGNVALDVARILLRSPSELSSTDIAEHAVKALRTSRIRKVYVVGRRGPVQAACTAKELREILGLKGVEIVINEADLQTTDCDLEELQSSRIHKRVFDLFCKSATFTKCAGRDKQLQFVFFRAPVSLLAAEDGIHVRGVHLQKTRLEGSHPRKLVGTGEFEELDCGLVLKSIGYKSLPVPDLPFDHKKGVVPNYFGRVRSSDATNETERGLYVAGWLKRGPTGIIGTNEVCAQEVVTSIEEDVNRAVVSNLKEVPGSVGLESILSEKNKRYITFEGWERLNETEMEKGAVKGKPREKIVGIDEALAIGLAKEKE